MPTAAFDASTSRIDCIPRRSCPPNSSFTSLSRLIITYFWKDWNRFHYLLTYMDWYHIWCSVKIEWSKSTPQNKPASASASVAGASGPMATAAAAGDGNGSGGGSGGGEEQEWVGWNHKAFKLLVCSKRKKIWKRLLFGHWHLHLVTLIPLIEFKLSVVRHGKMNEWYKAKT